MNKALISLALPLTVLLAACNMGAGGNASSADESVQGDLHGARIGAPLGHGRLMTMNFIIGRGSGTF